ncbi:DUF6428 family protein [Verrucomicrobiaceae bacterium 227]
MDRLLQNDVQVIKTLASKLKLLLLNPMNLPEFLELLKAHPNKGITLALPDGTTAPAHFHITEVGQLTRSFLDCGGKKHRVETCLLQVWTAQDYNHRIQAGKLANIVTLATDLFDDSNIPVEFEHEAPVLTQMPITSFEVTNGQLVFNLTHKATDCLAKDICIPRPDFTLPDIPNSGLKSSTPVFNRI